MTKNAKAKGLEYRLRSEYSTAEMIGETPRDGIIYADSEFPDGTVLGSYIYLIGCRLGNNIVIGDGAFISDDTRIGNYAKFGAGCRFGDHVAVGTGAQFGRETRFGSGALIGVYSYEVEHHKVIFGDYTSFDGGAEFNSPVSFGDFAFIGANGDFNANAKFNYDVEFGDFARLGHWARFNGKASFGINPMLGHKEALFEDEVQFASGVGVFGNLSIDERVNVHFRKGATFFTRESMPYNLKEYLKLVNPKLDSSQFT